MFGAEAAPTYECPLAPAGSCAIAPRSTTCTDAALLDLRTFRSRDFAVSVAMMSVAMVSLFGAFIVLPQFARYTLGLDRSGWAPSCCLAGC